MIQMSKGASAVLKAFEEDPSKMNAVLEGKEENVIRGVLGENASEEEIKAVTDEVNSNQVMQLFMGANGQLDANDLMHAIGSFNSDSTRANPTKSSGIAALLDGKLDINDLLAIIGLLGGGVSSNNLLSGLTSSQNQAPSNSMNLFGNLLGGNTQQQTANQSVFSSLFSSAKPQQTAANPTDILLQSLLGGSKPQQQVQQQTNPLAALFGQQAKPQQTQQTQSVDASALINALLGGAQQTQPQTQQTQNVDASALLNALLGGNASQGAQSSGTYQNAQYPNQQFGLAEAPTQTNQKPAQSSANTVNASDIFSVVSGLLGKK